MIEVVIGIVALGFLGYLAFKIIVKHETPLEAIIEMKDEFVHEAKHLEEIVEHKIDDTMHHLEEGVATKQKLYEIEERKLAAKAKYDAYAANKDKS